MLEARIVSPRGSLYYAGDSHPYDLETLWEHVRDVSYEGNPRDVELEAHRGRCQSVINVVLSGNRQRDLTKRLHASPDRERRTEGVVVPNIVGRNIGLRR